MDGQGGDRVGFWSNCLNQDGRDIRIGGLGGWLLIFTVCKAWGLMTTF